jgi:hypothetical protein
VKAALANRLGPVKVRGRHFAIDEGSEAGIWNGLKRQQKNVIRSHEQTSANIVK